MVIDVAGFTDVFWKFFTPAATLVAGIFLERYKTKSIVLEKNINTQAIASSIDDPEIGKIQTLYNDAEIQNLSLATIEIFNDSTKSVKNFNLDISVENGYFIYRETGVLIQRELSKSLSLTQEFINRRLFVNGHFDEDDKPENFNNELNHVVRHRQFHIPIFNKKSKILVTLLVDGPTFLQSVNVGIFEENVDLIFKQDAQKQSQIQKAIINLVSGITYLVCAVPIIRHASSIKESVIWMIINSITCYLVGFIVYLVYTFVRSFIRRK